MKSLLHLLFQSVAEIHYYRVFWFSTHISITPNRIPGYLY